jgi:septum site-determining protein MinC
MENSGNDVGKGSVGDPPKAESVVKQLRQIGGGDVAARGTGEGLVIRLDGRVDAESLKQALHDFVVSRHGFLAGNEVSFEWVGAQPGQAVVEELSGGLLRDFGISVRASVLRQKKRLTPSVETAEQPKLAPEKTLNLFSGVEDLADDEEFGVAGTASHDEKAGLEELMRSGEGRSSQAGAWDDPDARIIYTTLRSGQRIETDHSLMVVGDVNSGAEIVAGGDIVVLGTLRGVAHAGAYDETGGGRFIFALVLQPTQLRIGAIISRGGADARKGPEVARVDDNMIVVEPYQARTVLNRLRRF